MFKCLTMAFTLAGMLSWGRLVPAQQRAEVGLFDLIDSNQDSMISADEVAENRRSIFERLLRERDENSDGKISRSEMSARKDTAASSQLSQTVSAAAAAERTFRSLDRNGDGKVTPEEVPENRRDVFRGNLARADKDSDGALNLEEFRASPRVLDRGLESALNTLAFFRAIDANGDGKFSGDELAKAGEALKSLDRDKTNWLLSLSLPHKARP